MENFRSLITLAQQLIAALAAEKLDSCEAALVHVKNAEVLLAFARNSSLPLHGIATRPRS
jgi:hypothetical protein